MMYKPPYHFKNWQEFCKKTDKIIEETNKLQKYVKFEHINKKTIDYPSCTYVLQIKYNNKETYTVIANSQYQYDSRSDIEFLVAWIKFVLSRFPDFSEFG